MATMLGTATFDPGARTDLIFGDVTFVSRYTY